MSHYDGEPVSQPKPAALKTDKKTLDWINKEEAGECTYAEHRMSPMCTLDELVDLARHHLLDVATDERQSHARGIDVELDRR